MGATDFSDTTISIHAAREGGDGFLRVCRQRRPISIHAAREGGDEFRPETRKLPGYFNPRRP